MATYYYDLSAAVNGTGTTVSPFNGTVWPGAALVAGDSHLFKRNSSRAFSFTIGTAGSAVNYIKFGAWFNSNGTDDTTQSRPLITTTVQAMAFGAAKDYIWLDNLAISARNMTVANDKSWVFLGTGGKVTNCLIDSNCGCIGAWDKDSITVSGNTMFGVSHSSANNNQILAIINSAAHSGYTVYANYFAHDGGGGTTSHCVACYCTVNTAELLGLTFNNNTIVTNAFVGGSPTPQNANQSAIGLRCLNTGNAAIYYNNIFYQQVGIFVAVGAGVLSTGAHLVGNVCNYNYHFGIGITSGTNKFTISYNTCCFNGTNISNGVLFAYGRGIELSSAAGQGSCKSHALTHNICTNNYNYGGPNDNASEGVGIGLDDGAVDCLVMANTLTDNEGNGVQAFGGGNNATWTDTHCFIYSNIFRNNCSNNYINRRSGGTHRSGSFNADVALSYVHGGSSAVVNNTFGGNTPVAISTDGNCDTLQYGNNIFYFIDHPITTALTPAANDYRNSIFRAPVQNYSTTAVDGNGEATFPLLSYSGNIDFVNNPGIDANYNITSSSNAYRGGVQFIVPGMPIAPSAITDFNDATFNTIGAAPSIGAKEAILDGTTEGGHNRKVLDHGSKA